MGKAFDRLRAGLEEAQDRVQTGSFIKFLGGELLSPKHKTRSWTVVSLYDDPLGVVRWHSAWRRYCFFPEPSTLFEEVCLREIGDFLEKQTKLHKAG